MSKDRFGFGRNWQDFSTFIDEARIQSSTDNLSSLLQTSSLEGTRFLDIGSGSGLSSLAALRLGADVTAFDYDTNSVAASIFNLQRHAPDANWTAEQGSALDPKYMAKLGTYDVVYSWGVLHHTGDMWSGIDLAAKTVAPDGIFALAIYNDQGGTSHRWRSVKKIYNRLPSLLRPVFAAAFGVYFELRAMLIRLVRLQNPFPFADWKKRRNDRGMSVWYDLVDWIGGYPFEVAKPEEIFDFLSERGFQLKGLRTCAGGQGCNEFLFVRKK